MGRVNFSRQYTHFFCWVYSIFMGHIGTMKCLYKQCSEIS